MEHTDPPQTLNGSSSDRQNDQPARYTAAVPLAWLFPPYSRSPARRYGAGILLGLVGAGIALPVALMGGSAVLSLAVLAVIVSGWYGGLGPAAVTATIGAASAAAFIAFGDPASSRGDVLRLLLFLPVAVLTAVLSDAVRRALLVSRELTQTQWQLLQAVLASEQQWRALADSTPTLISTADVEGNVTFCNRAFLDYLGIGADALAGLDWSANVHPDDREAIVRQYEAATATDRPASAELRMRRHDGTYRWFLGYLSPIREASGAVTGWVGASIDVQDTRDAEAEAERGRRREELLRQDAEAREAYARVLFDSSSDAILVADAEGRYIDANRAASALLGYEVGELIGMRVDEIVAAEPDWTENEYQTFMETGRWRGEVEVRHRDGALIPVEAAATTIPLDSGTIGVSALRDVSERRRFDELRQHFLASVSHELRNVLTPILGNAQLLARQQQFDETSVREILDEARRLERIIADLTDAASAEAGRFDLTRSECDLAELVRQVVESFEGRSERHPITLTGEERPVYGVWDRGRLQQVFENLLSNAIKYSPDGGAVEVVINPLPEAVEVSVSDQGIGLAPDEISSLFQPFQRAGGARGTGISGVGLGLHVVRLIVEAHGGAIHVQSAGRMQGARFELRLPYK